MAKVAFGRVERTLAATLVVLFASACGGGGDTGDSAPATGDSLVGPVELDTGPSVVTSTSAEPVGGGEVLLAATPPSEGEVVLEPVGVDLAHPFSASVATHEDGELTIELPELPIPTTTEALPAGTVGLAQIVGAQPGLYGGTREMDACDAARLVDFLTSELEKGAAWAEVQGIEAGAIGEYVAGLTPVILTRDTRVTNHGFVDGRARPHQSVLQAGHAVFVDEFGVPRAKCSCGNPLAPPQPLDVTPTYVGRAWPGFGTGPVVVVVPDRAVDEFEVVDIVTGNVVRIPRGTTGLDDRRDDGEIEIDVATVFQCGTVELFRGDEVLTGTAFVRLTPDGTMYYFVGQGDDPLGQALPQLAAGAELEASGPFSVVDGRFEGETFQAYSGVTNSYAGEVVSPDAIEMVGLGTCRRLDASAGPGADVPIGGSSTAEDAAAQVLDLLLLDCGVEFDALVGQGGDDTSWRFLVDTPDGTADFTVFSEEDGGFVTQPNDEFSFRIAARCGFYQE